jgi:putative phosphoribosyl transferase
MAGAVFLDRRDAGRRLGRRLAALQPAAPVVLGLPRGGVPVALEVATLLNAPLDVLLARKIGAPGDPELAIGAVAGTPSDPEILIHEATVRVLGLAAETVQAGAKAALDELARRRALYSRPGGPAGLAGRTVIVVDDGIATGATMAVALRRLRRDNPAALWLAVPVAPPSALAALRPLCDRVEVLVESEAFLGVGQFYDDFRQLADADVIAALQHGPPS